MLLNNNASIYGANNNIVPSCQNFIDFHSSEETIDLVYMSPPWGGISYYEEAALLPT